MEDELWIRFDGEDVDHETSIKPFLIDEQSRNLTTSKLKSV